MGRSESENHLGEEIPDSVSAQVEYLQKLSSEILEKAMVDGQLLAAQSALGVVNRAYTYNGTDQRMMKVADTIIEKAGEFLGTISPEAGLLLSKLGRTLLSDKIYPLTIPLYLEEDALKLTPDISQGDLFFYQVINNGGLYDKQSKAEIGDWILGQKGWQPPEIEKDPKALDLKSLSEAGPAFRQIVTNMIMGKDLPNDEQLTKIRSLVQEAIDSDASPEEVYAALFQKTSRKRKK